MILVKIELHSAVTGKITEIGRMLIFNTGTGSARRRNYHIALLKRGTKDKVQRSGEVLAHPSLSASVWTLVRKALQAVKL